MIGQVEVKTKIFSISLRGLVLVMSRPEASAVTTTESLQV